MATHALSTRAANVTLGSATDVPDPDNGHTRPGFSLMVNGLSDAERFALNPAGSDAGCRQYRPTSLGDDPRHFGGGIQGHPEEKL